MKNGREEHSDKKVFIKSKSGIYARYIKRVLDFGLSLIAVLILSPVLLILTMVGNPFFVQERPGKNEKIFKLVKFRIMTNKKISRENFYQIKKD